MPRPRRSTADPQLGLFDDERRQSERDLRQIRARMDALADERERELAAVDARYEDVQAAGRSRQPCSSQSRRPTQSEPEKGVVIR